MRKVTSIGKNILSTFVSLVITVIIIYIIFNIGKSIWYNHNINQKITNIELEIVELKNKNSNLMNLITYYQSDSFKEIEARRKLGLKKPDEQMTIIPENKDQNHSGEEIKTEQGVKIIANNKQKKIPNYLIWWDYLMGK